MCNNVWSCLLRSDTKSGWPTNILCTKSSADDSTATKSRSAVAFMAFEVSNNAIGICPSWFFVSCATGAPMPIAMITASSIVLVLVSMYRFAHAKCRAVFPRKSWSNKISCLEPNGIIETSNLVNVSGARSTIRCKIVARCAGSVLVNS